MKFMQTLQAYAKKHMFSEAKKMMGGVAQTSNLFEKRYSTSQRDLAEKLKIMELFNHKKEKLAAQRHDSIDMRIVCDLMLDCLYYEKEKLIKSPTTIIQEYGNQQGSYNLDSFIKKVAEVHRPMVAEMFKIIAAAKSRNIDAVAQHFAEALLYRA